MTFDPEDAGRDMARSLRSSKLGLLDLLSSDLHAAIDAASREESAGPADLAVSEKYYLGRLAGLMEAQQIIFRRRNWILSEDRSMEGDAMNHNDEPAGGRALSHGEGEHGAI
jgi:hypothetical protein